MTPITAKRAGAFWVLLCWLWFSAAAPFAHTCARSRVESSGATIGSATACVSCQWMACEKRADAPPAPMPGQPRTAPRVFVASPVSTPPVSAPLSFSPRGPPVHILPAGQS